MPPIQEYNSYEDTDSAFGIIQEPHRSMESSALRQQLDRARVLQQQNCTLSGDKVLSPKPNSKNSHDGGIKPNNVKNYYKWIRGVADGDPTALRVVSPVTTPRPRSQSLQLDAGHFSASKQIRRGSDDSASKVQCDSPLNSKAKTKQPGGSLRLAQKDSTDSNEDIPSGQPSQKSDVKSQTRMTSSHGSKTRGVRTVEGNLTKNTVKSSSVAKLKPHPVSANQTHIKSRDHVIKPNGNNKKLLSPLKQSRRKSADNSLDKFVEITITRSDESKPSSLPEIRCSSDTSSDDEKLGSQPFSPSDSRQSIKKPISILKKLPSDPCNNHTNPKRAQYSARVTFSESPILISTPASARRASIATENPYFSYEIIQNSNNETWHGNHPSSPPPPSFQRYTEDDNAWMTPGKLPGLRRNSLPPLSVSMSQIQAVGDSDEDDQLFLSAKKERNSDEDYNNDKFDHSKSLLSSKTLYPKQNIDYDSEESEDSQEKSEPKSSSVKDILPVQSCFIVRKKTGLQDADSDEEIRCTVVHSFTPRKNLKANCLSSNGVFSSAEEELFELP